MGWDGGGGYGGYGGYGGGLYGGGGYEGPGGGGFVSDQFSFTGSDGLSGIVGNYGGYEVAIANNGYSFIMSPLGNDFELALTKIDWGKVENQTLGGAIVGCVGGAVTGGVVAVATGGALTPAVAVGALGGAVGGAITGGLMEIWNEETGH
jgi:hypothetical protein